MIILSLLGIVRHVYDNNEGYVKIQSLFLQAFSTILDEIKVDTKKGLGGHTRFMHDKYDTCMFEANNVIIPFYREIFLKIQILCC